MALGFVEGLDNKIRVLQRRAYGLRDEECLRLKILTALLPPYKFTDLDEMTHTNPRRAFVLMCGSVSTGRAPVRVSNHYGASSGLVRNASKRARGVSKNHKAADRRHRVTVLEFEPQRYLSPLNGRSGRCGDGTPTLGSLSMKNPIYAF